MGSCPVRKVCNIGTRPELRNAYADIRRDSHSDTVRDTDSDADGYAYDHSYSHADSNAAHYGSLRGG